MRNSGRESSTAPGVSRLTLVLAVYSPPPWLSKHARLSTLPTRAPCARPHELARTDAPPPSIPQAPANGILGTRHPLFFPTSRVPSPQSSGWGTTGSHPFEVQYRDLSFASIRPFGRVIGHLSPKEFHRICKARHALFAKRHGQSPLVLLARLRAFTKVYNPLVSVQETSGCLGSIGNRINPGHCICCFFWWSQTSLGYGSNLNHQGTAGFSPFHLPGFHFGVPEF